MEIQRIAPFELAYVMQKEQNWPGMIKLADLCTNDTMSVSVGDRYDYQGSVIDRVMKQGAIRIIDNTAELSNETDKGLFADQGYKACVLAPLISNGEVNGVLALAGRSSKVFHENDDFIEWAGQVVSFAIEQTNLSAAVTKRDREMATIKQIGGALASSTFDIGSVLNYTMEMIQEIMDVEAGALLLADDENKELYFASGFNNNPDVDISSLQSFTLKFGQGIAGSVAARGESIIVNDIESSSKFFNEVD
jgi:transcriptional regulator with GAF, ATPase, and Fis domain